MPITSNLTTSANKEYLGAHIVHIGNSRIVIVAPHSGDKLPEDLTPQDFGFDSYETMQASHEACDVGIKKLVTAINQHHPDISTVSAEVSRIFIDLNRKWDKAIPQKHSETSKAIPNYKTLSEAEKETRKNLYLETYYGEVKRAITNVEENLGPVFVLDLHSFTPTHNGQARDVDIGTLRLEETPQSRIFEATLGNLLANANLKRDDAGKHVPLTFKPDTPYSLMKGANTETNGAREFKDRQNLNHYVGLEIAQNLLQDDEMITALANAIVHASQAASSGYALELKQEKAETKRTISAHHSNGTKEPNRKAELIPA